MDFRGTLQWILRVIWTYAAVVMILLICLCVGLWSAIENSLRATSDTFQRMFRRRQNVSFIESDDETLKDEFQTTPKSTNPPSDDTPAECNTSSTFSDLTENGNSEEEKATNKQMKNDQSSTEENFSNLEGLALQMAHIERHRVSTDLPCQLSSSEVCVRSPNESSPVNVIKPKSVLKSSCTDTKSPPSTRGARRIRFKDLPISTSAGFTSWKKPLRRSSSGSELRKISPAANLTADLDFQESPAKSSETKSRISEQSPEALQIENDPLFLSSSEIASSQQQTNKETGSLSEEPNYTVSTKFSSVTVDSDQIANEGMDPSTEELDSTVLTPLSSETADYQQIACESMGSVLEKLNSSALSSEFATNEVTAPYNESVGSLSEELNPTNSSVVSTITVTNQQVSEELNPTNPSVLSTETVTNQQVDDKSLNFSSHELNSTNCTALCSETATDQEITMESMNSLSEEYNSTVPMVYEGFEDSLEVGDRSLEQGRVESKLKSDERNLPEQISKNICTGIKEMKVEEFSFEELRYTFSVKEKAAASNKNEESFKKVDSEDSLQLPQKSETVIVGESLREKNSLSESAICQQTTEELINANLTEFTSSDELNPTMLKTDEELCKSVDTNDQFKQKSTESSGFADHEEPPQDITIPPSHHDFSGKRDGTSSCEVEASFKNEESKNDSL